jgi:hypothetical protein
MPRGRYSRTPAHLAQLKAARSHIKHRPLSEETKRRIGDKLRKGSKYSEEEKRIIIAARRTVNNAIRDGRITRQNCHCGQFGEAHHPDYTKPLEVIWLCRKHHEDLHRNVIGIDFKPELLEKAA